MKADTHYFSIAEVLNDPNVSMSMPKYNDEFRMNVSGMTFKQLAECLHLVAECIEIGTNGHEEATAEWQVPFLKVDITSHEKFKWEDGYEDCGYQNIALIHGVGTHADGSCTVTLSDAMKQATEDGKTISEYLRRKIKVSNTKDGQKVTWEYE